MMRTQKNFSDILEIKLERFGLKDNNVDIIHTPEGFRLVLSHSIDLDRHRHGDLEQKSLEGILKLIGYRIAESRFVKDLTKDKDLKIKELEEKVDKLIDKIPNNEYYEEEGLSKL